MLNISRYEIGILGAGAVFLGGRLRTEIVNRVSELGDNLSGSLRFFEAGEEPDSRSPAVAVYFGRDDFTDATAVVKLLAASVPILPVVSDLKKFNSQVPPALGRINGTTLDFEQPDFSEIVNLVLENLSLLRRSRRLFLSYRRTESTPAAQQLRVAFDAQGYDAFLDTNSVPKGDEFQSVLWHRLLDSDLMVVLATKGFLNSKYTKLEIANASAMTVGMLHVLWPGVKLEPFASLSFPLQLEDDDFEGEHLTDAAVARIISTTEALRARCLAARHSNLVVEFCEEARRIGAVPTVQPGRYVLAEMPDGRRIAAIPAVGVPDALRYHEASARFPVGHEGASEALLIYDHRGMLPQWTGFLDWLDDFLPVKGLRVTDTATKLGKA